MTKKPFNGSNVFMSRKLVPPELFDSLHDALKLNGAHVFLCCDPSRNAPNDYHIISSHDHEKFKELRFKGCNLLGPQCVLSCSKEHRVLPKQGFTCCLAMDGVRVLASGFKMDEKVRIEKLVNSMGGVLQTKVASDISFVVVKNVLAAKYKWAFNVLQKPILNVNWLYQCSIEHRVVPHESYGILPFSGLTICVTKIPTDERKQMGNIIVQNGGKYAPDLTRECTHLICDVPEGDKFKVAQRWGHIHLVTRKWFDASVARNACVNEDCYPVQDEKGRLEIVNSPNKDFENIPPITSVVENSNSQPIKLSGTSEKELETTLSQRVSSAILNASKINKEEENIILSIPSTSETNFVGYDVADSQTEDSDLYLSKCRILFVGLEASEMQKLLKIVQRGGGTQYMSFNEKLTHIIVGNPSEYEKKEVRSLAALGIIYVVRTIWLEECEHEKKQIPVIQRHIANDLLIPKVVHCMEGNCSNKGSDIGMIMLRGEKDCIPPDGSLKSITSSGNSIEKNNIKNMEIDRKVDFVEASTKFSLQNQILTKKDKSKDPYVMQPDTCVQHMHDGKLSAIFNQKIFCFSDSFPKDKRVEIMEWVKRGGGEVLSDPATQKAHFTVECHGVVPKSFSDSTMIPLPGFGCFKFCVSHYEKREKLLLKNLCVVLGAAFKDKLYERSTTHLLCKFTRGRKYEAACKWGIRSVTSEWIYACIQQNAVVALDPYCPKEAPKEEQEVESCSLSTISTQSTRMVSGVDQFMLSTESPNPVNLKDIMIRQKFDSFEGDPHSNPHYKRARLSLKHWKKDLPVSSVCHNHPTPELNSIEKAVSEDALNDSVVPDVATAIDNLLQQQTRKNQDLEFLESATYDKNENVDPRSASLLCSDWLNRAEKKCEGSNPPGHANGSGYDGFSETLTDSQVVGYEEDLSGRQMIIDRVRHRIAS